MELADPELPARQLKYNSSRHPMSTDPAMINIGISKSGCWNVINSSTMNQEPTKKKNYMFVFKSILDYNECNKFTK